MADGRSRAAWGHTSSLMALLANINRNPKKRSRPFSPNDFNPHAEKPVRRPLSVESLTRSILAVAENRRGRGNPPRTKGPRA